MRTLPATLCDHIKVDITEIGPELGYLGSQALFHHSKASPLHPFCCRTEETLKFESRVRDSGAHSDTARILAPGTYILLQITRSTRGRISASVESEICETQIDIKLIKISLSALVLVLFFAFSDQLYCASLRTASYEETLDRPNKCTVGINTTPSNN